MEERQHGRDKTFVMMSPTLDIQEAHGRSRQGVAIKRVVGNSGCGVVNRWWALIQAMRADATETPAGSPGGVLEEGGGKERHGGAMVVRMLMSCQRLGINKTSLKRCV